MIQRCVSGLFTPCVSEAEEHHAGRANPFSRFKVLLTVYPGPLAQTTPRSSQGSTGQCFLGEPGRLITQILSVNNFAFCIERILVYEP